MLPGGKARRLRGQECSRAALRYQFRLLQFFRRWLAVENAVTQHDSLKFHRHFRNGFGVAEEEIAAGLQRFIKASAPGRAGVLP